MQQLNLPSSNISNYSNVSKQSETLVSGLNNISFDNYNNTCIFNNKMDSLDNSATLDLIDKLFYNIGGISFTNQSILKGISDGYTLDLNDNLVLEYNSEIALSTVFGYNIKQQNDLTDNNLAVEIMSRQADSNLLRDTISEVETRALHAESMIHYINYDLVKHIMAFTIPIPDESSTKEGYMDKLPSEKIIGLTEEEILEANPKNTLTKEATTKYIDFNVAVFNEDGMYAPIISSDLLVMDKDYGEIHSKDIYCNGLGSSVIINEDIIQTGSLSFYNKPPMFPSGIKPVPDENGKIPLGTLTGIDNDMHLIELNPEVIQDPTYDGTCFTHTVSSYLIRTHIEQLYKKCVYLGMRLDAITNNLYDPNTHASQPAKQVDFLDPYSNDGTVIGTVELEAQDLAKYEFLNRLWVLEQDIKKVNNPGGSFNYADFSKYFGYTWIGNNKWNTLTMLYCTTISPPLPYSTASLIVEGDVEIRGNIYLVDEKKNVRRRILYKKKNGEFVDEDEYSARDIFAPLYHTHDQYSLTTHTHSQYSLTTHTHNEFYTKDETDTYIKELEDTVATLTTKIANMKTEIEEIKHFINFESSNPPPPEPPDTT